MNYRKSNFSIEDREIGLDFPPYCIVEVGLNHNGSVDIAKKMINEAKKAGADAVKFQTFKAEEFCGDPEQLFTYKSQGKEITESMLEMFKRHELAPENWIQIKSYCDEVGITFFSTPQNASDLDILLDVGVPAIKIGSDDFSNLPLIKTYQKTGLPIILSCGMSNLAEVDQALSAVGWFEGYPASLLLCTSQYPTSEEDVNIHKLTTLQGAFPGLVVGFSDHTVGTVAAIMALASGARIFEKHFTLDHDMPGPDHWFAETPDEIACWIGTIRTAYKMLGSKYVRPADSEKSNRIEARRSVVALVDIAEGELLDSSNIGLRRPGDGLAPSLLGDIFGLTSVRTIKRGEKLALGDMSN